jgi:hypothetical protein
MIDDDGITTIAAHVAEAQVRHRRAGSRQACWPRHPRLTRAAVLAWAARSPSAPPERQASPVIPMDERVERRRKPRGARGSPWLVAREAIRD